MQQALERLLRPGGTFWDVGAHAGFFTLLASRLVGGQGRVDAFEPSPENRRRLVRALSLNAAANVHVHDCAVSDRIGAATLYGSTASVTWSLLPDGAADAAVTVPSQTLDALAQSLPAPDVLKIDAEGTEVGVLRGGLQLLRERRPVVLVEMDAAAAGAVRDTMPFYSVERLDPTHWLLQ